MKRFRTITLQYDIPLYESKLTVIVYKSDKAANIAIDKAGFTYKVHTDEKGFSGRETINNSINHLIVLKIIEDNQVELERTFVHELFHMVQDILEYREIWFKRGDANESWAYLLDSIYGMVIKDLKCLN